MATTTPVFGWPVPTSTDLVTNGATAIESLGDAIDTRLGSASFPNQIVNNISGTVRPIAFSMRTGRATVAANSSVSITFPSGRFTLTPMMITSFESTSTTLSGPSSGIATSTTAGNLYNSSSASRAVTFIATQMTSANELG